MSEEAGFVAPPAMEGVQMVEQEVIRRIRVLAEAGWGAKSIAAEVGVARNTVRRYLRRGSVAEVQTRPEARCLTPEQEARAVDLWKGPAAGNAVVVRRLLTAEGIDASVRTVQRALRDERRQVRAAEVATVRYETAPGRQMQIDFGEKKLVVGGRLVKVFLLVAVLSHSRRLFVKAFLNQRGDDWREGIAAAFHRFGGVPQELLGDNAKALVVARDRDAGTVRFHPAYLEFCRDWDVQPRACGPYRARTKGKTESGVKYVKRNGLAARSFETFGALVAHLDGWMDEADRRIHGTTHEQPLARFERDERAALRPLPGRSLRTRVQRLRRRVAHDALVDVDTIRYSVPHRFVRDHVDVEVSDSHVRVFRGTELVATHVRTFEPHQRVVDPAHWAGLWKPVATDDSVAQTESHLGALGRSLADYEALLSRGAA